MSQLSDKILSYPVETYIPMHSAVTVTNPEMYGTFLPTATPYMNTTAVVPTYDSTSNPPGADGGSWRFTVGTTGNAAYIRTNSTTYNNQKVWDGLYGFGIWVKLNSIPTGTTTASYSLFSTARTSSFPGFSITLRGTAHTSGPGIVHNLFSSTTPIISNPVVGQWYYIVGRKNKSTNGATIWVNGVKVATGTNTSGVEPVTSVETPYQLTFQTANPSSVSAYSFNLSHAHLMDFANFTDAAIVDIYNAGSTAPITNNLKYWDGTAWTVPVNKYTWDGTNWVTTVGKYWNGSSWTNIT